MKRAVQAVLVLTTMGCAAGCKTTAPSREEIAERTGEAQANLKSLYTSHVAFKLEKGRFSTNARWIAFSPERKNRYAYFLAADGIVERRDAKEVHYTPGEERHIIGPDTLHHPGAGVPDSLGDTGCPVTPVLGPDGKPVLKTAGVTGGDLTEPHFIAYAVGNLDDDPGFDCWSISDAVRVTAEGLRVEAGELIHERNDYDEKAAPTRW